MYLHIERNKVSYILAENRTVHVGRNRVLGVGQAYVFLWRCMTMHEA